MSIDFRAALERLVELDDTVPHNRPGWSQEWSDAIATARAVLAEREVVSVVDEPSDEEIMGLMPQQMHDDLATAVRAIAEQEGIDSTPAKGVLRFILNRHVVDLARAVLARWGHQPAPPAQRHPQPVPVSERLPGPEDCDGEGLCWVWNRTAYTWGVFRLDPTVHSHWLPANALPLPLPQQETPND